MNKVTLTFESEYDELCVELYKYLQKFAVELNGKGDLHDYSVKLERNGQEIPDAVIQEL